MFWSLLCLKSIMGAVFGWSGREILARDLGDETWGASWGNLENLGRSGQKLRIVLHIGLEPSWSLEGRVLEPGGRVLEPGGRISEPVMH